MRILGLTLLSAAITLTAADIFPAIRSGDPRAVKQQLAAGASIEAPNADGITPLLYAVTTAGVPVLRTLLDRGANPNAATADGITALHAAAYDVEKTRLLLKRGAQPDAQTKAGETPLLIAADRPGSSPVIALLIAKGANPNHTPPNKFTALLRAATNGDAAAMRLLLAKGAKVSPESSLARSAAFGHCRECLALALANGANPNADFQGRTPLQDAAGFGDLAMVQMLVEKGADIQPADRRGYTALMRAAISYEPGALQVVEYLLAKGAATNPKNETGDTALSFARRFGETPIVAALKKANAPDANTPIRVPAPLTENTPQAAIARALPLLQRIGAPVVKAKGCASCHNNSIPALAVSFARSRGIPVNDEAAKAEYQSALQASAGRRRANLTGTGVPDLHPFPLIGLAAENPAPTATTDLMVHHISTRQDPSGRFRGQDYRPPQEYTDITFTATALRALQLYPLPGRAAEWKDRIQRATRWLAAQQPRDTEEHALRLMALSWSNAAKTQAVEQLIALQREDGGWAQTATLATDAYATGQSLYALHLAGIPATHPAYQKGVNYLLKTQRKDGSWYVTSRSHPVQPLFDAGHPYFNHQWISAAAGGWSTLALIATLPAPAAGN